MSNYLETIRASLAMSNGAQSNFQVQDNQGVALTLKGINLLLKWKRKTVGGRSR